MLDEMLSQGEQQGNPSEQNNMGFSDEGEEENLNQPFVFFTNNGVSSTNNRPGTANS